jgi:hypothetical protein
LDVATARADAQQVYKLQVCFMASGIADNI